MGAGLIIAGFIIMVIGALTPIKNIYALAVATVFISSGIITILRQRKQERV